MHAGNFAISVMNAWAVTGASGLSAADNAAQKQPLTVNIKRLSLDTALRIGKAAIDQRRKEVQ
jgi:hypothetical protein